METVGRNWEILNIGQYLDEIDIYDKRLTPNIAARYGEAINDTDVFEIYDDAGAKTRAEVPMACGPQAIFLTFKGQISAKLFFIIKKEELIVTQIIGCKDSWLGTILDWRKLLLVIAEKFAVQTGAAQSTIRCGENSPYYLFGRLENNHRNSIDVGNRTGYTPALDGNMVKELQSGTARQIESMVETLGTEPDQGTHAAI